MARLRAERKTFLATFSTWMARLRTHCKIFLVTFSLAFAALFIIHLVYLPYYWANASSQQGIPTDLYLPNVWTPPIIYYSVTIAIFAVVTFSLLSWLRKGKANEITIFSTTFFLVWIGFWVLFALAGLQWGHTMRLPSFGQDPKGEYARGLGTLLFSFGGAVLSVAVFEFYKLVRWTRKRQVREDM